MKIQVTKILNKKLKNSLNKEFYKFRHWHFFKFLIHKRSSLSPRSFSIFSITQMNHFTINTPKKIMQNHACIWFVIRFIHLIFENFTDFNIIGYYILLNYFFAKVHRD